MKLTQKDKKLLLVLAIVIVVCIPYFFVIQPMLDRCNLLQNDITSLRSEAKYVQQLALLEGEYETGAEQMADKSTGLLSRFPSDLPQEATLLFVHNTEQMIPISLYQVSFGDDVSAQLTSNAEAEAIQEVEAETGDAGDEAVVEDTTTTTNLGGGLVGLSTTTRYAYDTGYEEFKNFLKYILEYQDRMVITELDASYSAELNLVNGNLTLAQYALQGRTRNKVAVLEPNMIQGTTNVFKQASGSTEIELETTKTPDFFIMLNRPEADVDSLVIGQSGDVTESSYFVSSKNDKQSVTITFTGELGSYNANYSIGKKSYNKEGIEFTKEGNILLQLMSSERIDDKDKVAIDLNIVNKTDTIVEVETLNEDQKNPRVELKGRTGDIVYEN